MAAPTAEAEAEAAPVPEPLAPLRDENGTLT